MKRTIVGALCALAATVSLAQTNLPATPREQEALQAVRAGRLVRARELAEAILRDQPSSVPAEYVLARALQDGEGNIPLALRHVRQALARVTDSSGRPRPGQELWGRELLLAEMYALSDLGRYEDLLAAARRYRELYDPAAFSMDVWPLMKLGRDEEARAAAAKALASGDRIEEVVARNGLCALDGWPACTEMLRVVRSWGVAPGLTLRNVAAAAQEVGRFEEAERLLLESTRFFDEDVNPWRDLCRLYCAEGRLSEALDAARRMFAFAHTLPARQRQHSGGEDLLAAGELLLLSGNAERAVAATDRALEAPDRASHWSGSAAEMVADIALLDRAVHFTLAQEEREAAALSPPGPWLLHSARALAQSARGWVSGRRAQSLIESGGLRPESAAFQTQPQLAAPSWLQPDAVALFGAGPTLALLEDARRARPGKDDPTPPELREAMLQALATEALWLRGDDEGCLAAGGRARAALPAATRLLRARVTLRMAQCALSAGRDKDAWPLFEEVLQQDPGAFRRLGAALPVETGPEAGGPLAGAVADALRGPRLTRRAGSPFLVTTEGSKLCLLGPGRASLACATDPGPRPAPPASAPRPRTSYAEPPGPQDMRTPAARTALALVRLVFAPRIDLSQEDLSTLDGTPSVERRLDFGKLEGMFETR